MMIVVDIFLQVITNWRSLLKWTYVKQDIAEELNVDCSRIIQNLQQTGKLEESDKAGATYTNWIKKKKLLS